MILDNFNLTDRVAIVAAAGRGIGAAIATAFAEVGADVVIGARRQEQLDEVAATIESLGRRAVTVAGDLSTRAGMAALIDRAASELGRIDVVVNNAGGARPGAFLETTEEAFNEAMRWNVTTAFNLTQLAVPHMLAAGGGSVINIASAAGRFAERGFAAYGTAKAALIHLSRNLALDLAPNIRVNVIAPGSILTSALERVVHDEAAAREMAAATPLKRLGRVGDVAAGAVYLASPASSYVTGRILDIDGGVQQSNLDLGLPDLD